MERVIDVAQFIFDEYKRVSNEIIDQMKLHKLLYFSQREHLAITNNPLFEEEFEGWKYGPVVPKVRADYDEYGMKCPTSPISDEAKYIVRNVIEQYGSIASWKLSEMTHRELSWKNSREGLCSEQNGARKIKLEDIKKDAEKVRPYDSIWDMYYDEFDDLDEDCV